MPANHNKLTVFFSITTLFLSLTAWSQPTAVEKIASLETVGPITAIQFIANSDKLIFSEESGALTILDLTTNKQTSFLSTGFPVAILEVSADGQHLAVAGKKAIAIYDLPSGKQLMFKEDFGDPGILHFDPDNSNILIYTREPKKLMYHDLGSGDRMQIKTVHPIVHFIYHTSGESLIVGTKQDTYSVDLNTGNTRVFYRQNQRGESNIDRLGIWYDHCRPLAFTNSGTFLYTRPYGSFRRYLTVFDSSTGELERNVNVNYHVALDENLQALGIAEDQDLMLIPQCVSEKPTQTGINLTLFNISNLKPIITVTSYSFKKKAKGNARVYYDLSSNGRYAASYCSTCEGPTLDTFIIK